jgi:prevent-host-death family protein
MPMQLVNIEEARHRLSQLVEKAAAGNDVIIGRNGKPVARITQLQPPKRVIRFGLLQGQFEVPDDFDAPLPHDVLAAFEGR